jgi:hypothetical protein
MVTSPFTVFISVAANGARNVVHDWLDDTKANVQLDVDLLSVQPRVRCYLSCPEDSIMFFNIANSSKI